LAGVPFLGKNGSDKWQSRVIIDQKWQANCHCGNWRAEMAAAALPPLYNRDDIGIVSNDIQHGAIISLNPSCVNIIS
jgi:hypothetical protein